MAELLDNDVVITGRGVISCIGNDVKTFKENLKLGKSGITFEEDFAKYNFRCRVFGKPVEPDMRERGFMEADLITAGKMSQYALAATWEALREAKLSKEDLQNPDTASIAGCGTCGVTPIVNAWEVLRTQKNPKYIGGHAIDTSMANTISANLTVYYRTQGIGEALASACATGLGNIGYAYRMIKHGYIKRAICGGSEDPHITGPSCFDAMRVLATGYNDNPKAASRPLAKDRKGFVAGYGAGMVIIETYEEARKRGLKPLAVIRGYYSGCDGSGDMNAPSSDGQIRCIEGTLRDGYLNKPRILNWKPDVVKLHGTSTFTGDVMEVKSVVKVLGTEGYLMTAPKSMFGHLLGPAGSVELIAALCMIEDSFVSPSINCEDNLDPELEPYRHLISFKTTYRPVDRVLCLNFGFGNTNAGMLIEKIT